MKVPVRKCVGCGTCRPKSKMIRVGASDGWRVTRAEVKMRGRGAYVCPTEECLRKAIDNRALERALGEKVPPGVREQVERLIRESKRDWQTP